MTSRALIVLALTAVLGSAQPRTDSCCECGANRVRSKHPVDIVCLSPQEMRAQVDHIEPLQPSGLGKGLNISGSVVLQVRFEPGGKVACARAKSGHPIAIAAAIEAIRKWTFKPLTSSREGKPGCGRITIKYRLRDHGSTTELGRVQGWATGPRVFGRDSARNYGYDGNEGLLG